MIERIMQWRPVRAFTHYSAQHGPIFAQSMALQAFLSIFAALFVAFGIFATVLDGNAELRSAVVDAIAGSVPGLIDQGDGGAIDVDQLLDSSVASWAAAIGAVGILVTAIAWIGVSREGFREMFELPTPKQNPLLLKVVDLGVAFGIGALVLVSAGGLVFTSGLASLLGLSAWTSVLATGAQLVLDTAIMLLLYRYGGHLRLPWRTLLGTAFVCALAFFVLKQFAQLLFGGIERNPLLASIASVVALLIWFGFISQIQLLSLAFVAVGARGAGYAKLEAALAAERERVAAAERDREQREAIERERVRRRLEEPRSGAAAINRRLRKQQRSVLRRGR